MKKPLSYLPLALITLMATSSKENIVKLTEEYPAISNSANIETVSRHVDNYLDFENATVSGTSHTETLTNNGKGYEIHLYGDGILPQLSTRRSAGDIGLRCAIPASSIPGKDRSEIETKYNMPFERVRVCAFDVYFDALFPSGGTGLNENNWLSFTQFWQYSPGMPIITLEVKHGSNLEYQLVVRNDDTGSEVATAPNPWPVRGYGSLSRGTWIRFALEVKISPNGGGYVKLYKNGNLEHTYTGKVGYSTAVVARQNVDWRCGIYRTGGYNWPASTIWLDEIKYGDTLSEVL